MVVLLRLGARGTLVLGYRQYSLHLTTNGIGQMLSFIIIQIDGHQEGFMKVDIQTS
jgi:hypothetical protein